MWNSLAGLSKVGCLFIGLIFCISAQGYCPKRSPRSGHPVEKIAVYDLVPTQFAYGATAADKIRKQYENDQGGFVNSFRNRFTNKPLPGIKGPSKQGGSAVYVIDNHHMVIPVQQAYTENRISDRVDEKGDRETLVCVAIEVDATHLAWEEFISKLYQGDFGNRLGYFRADVRESLERLHQAKEEAFIKANASFLNALSRAYGDLFSKKLDQLEDLPLRSEVANLAKSLGIQGRFFKEYIEFMLVEKIQNQLAHQLPTSKTPSILTVFKVLFGNQEILEFWKDQLKSDLSSEDREQVLKILSNARKFYIENLADLNKSELTQRNLFDHYINR